MENFRNELEVLLNKHSMDNESNCPDFILADYLIDCLKSYNRATTRRDNWHDINIGDKLRLKQE